MMESYYLSQVVCFVYFLSSQLCLPQPPLTWFRTWDLWQFFFYDIFVFLNVTVKYSTSKMISMVLSYQTDVFAQDFILTSQMYHSHRNDTDHCSRTNNERNKTVVDLKHVDQFISPRLGFVHEWDSCIVRETSLWVFGSVDIASNVKFNLWDRN
uniref:Uncharacterized protein n=1 Tax=Cacopsylla melanoneura TaxID=428564 RepID=A0A8D9F9N1_9HEMI